MVRFFCQPLGGEDWVIFWSYPAKDFVTFWITPSGSEGHAVEPILAGGGRGY
jgi:hypothetical protein